MSRSTLDTKCRLCRAQGAKLYLKCDRCLSAKCPIEKKAGVGPGMHGAKRASKPTDYGIQLKAKQKAKRIYGVQEKQFKNYFIKAKALKGLVGDNLLALLERRLDNVIYAAGYALSRSQAKQLVSHGQVYVNGKALNIPSYTVKIGDVVTIDDKMLKLIGDKAKVNDKDFTAPTWLQIDKAQSTITIISLPLREDISKEIDENLIIEYYSR